MTEETVPEVRDAAAREAAARVAEYEHGWSSDIEQEFGPKGLRFNAICPGLVKTEFARELWDNPDVEKRIKNEIPLRRLGQPDEVARVRIDQALGAEIETHLRDLVHVALDQEVKSAGFVDTVRATRPGRR